MGKSREVCLVPARHKA